jgi:hypothetical protein
MIQENGKSCEGGLILGRFCSRNNENATHFMEEILKVISPLTLACVTAAAFVNAALADDTVYTRSLKADYADLIRDWNYNDSGTRGVVRRRNSADIYADLIRDWNGASKAAIAVEKK